ncbi:MAG: hypothetical protein JSS76_15595 [Bacteroidetes bacterium]|nr:hypothetical protein [Bacteroidota bacterium]
MLKICAIFENWYLGDGIYPYLGEGHEVNLSFYIQSEEFTFCEVGTPFFKQTNAAESDFCGKIIAVYREKSLTTVVVDTDGFKFYVECPNDKYVWIPGHFISGSGSLLVDYSKWVENLNSYADAPDIFFNFEVVKIEMVKIPERFITRFDNGYGFTSPLSPADYSDSDVYEIRHMIDNTEHDCFFLLYLTEIDKKIPVTFVY